MSNANEISDESKQSVENSNDPRNTPGPPFTNMV